MMILSCCTSLYCGYSCWLIISSYCMWWCVLWTCYIITLSLWFLKLPPSYSSSLITEPCVVYSYYSAEVNKCDLDKVIPPATDRNDNILPPTPVLQYVSIPHTNYLLTHCVCLCFSYTLFVYLYLALYMLLCACLCVLICVCLSACVFVVEVTLTVHLTVTHFSSHLVACVFSVFTTSRHLRV